LSGPILLDTARYACRLDSDGPYIRGDWARPGYTIHLAQISPADLILVIHDIKKGNTTEDNIIAETRFTGLLEVWELHIPDFSVKWFVDRPTLEVEVDNTMFEHWDGAILNASINVHSPDVTLLLVLLKKTTKLLPLSLGARQICAFQRSLALKVPVCIENFLSRLILQYKVVFEVQHTFAWAQLQL
jgi:hypothetical protein